MGYSNNNFELISVIRSYAEQRGIGYLSVIGAVEESIRVFEASKYKYNKIVVKLDPNSGKIETFKELLVIEDGSSGKQSGVFIDGYECIGLSDARKIYGDISIGDIVMEQLPPISLRDSARDAFFSKKALNNKLSDIIKAKYFDVFKDLIGENVTGIVKRIDSKTLTLDVQNMETVISVSNLIKGEFFRKGDRIKAYLSSVVKESDAVHLNLSRTHPQFVVQLFKQEVPEVYDGIIHIKSVARIAGIKTKISVTSSDSNIDPVGACVGMRGSRVKAIIDELRGEKIDIIEYSQDPAKFVINALPTVEVVKVILDEEEKEW
uniref:S1 motif domain-containing protein n=1 Tax=Biomphalaria glabrata TaxID=6526 RepID=A0A2C9LEY8_BIOGL